MMRILRPLVVVLAGFTLAAAGTGSAVASNGTFAWVGPNGRTYSIQNPPDNKCYDLGQEARGAHNATRQPVVVYPRKKCKGTPTRLASGQAAPNRARFASVIFNPR
ncbi:hypothetical protein ABZY03_16120 [Streptomyces klenkii]|uniref:hypothetical protein n=1 Tax=Streptomyces TaxID=1883 RepID=UPI001892CF1A|nr:MULTISPECIES: hypothetical protein [Streptomyces]